MEESEDMTGTWGDWALDRTARGALWAAARLPYERRIPAFGRLARGLTGSLTPFRKRMLENLDYVMPELGPGECNRIATGSADNIGRTLIEHYSMRELAARMARVVPTGPGMDSLEAARADGRPVILITGHYGNYESIWACLTARGTELGGFYRPMANPYINRHYVETVSALGNGPLFSQDRTGMGQLLRYLKGGGGVLMLNDLYVGSGVEMDFLGKLAMTSLSAAELAIRFDAPLIPVFSTRQPDGISFSIEADAAIPAGDPFEMTSAFNRALEDRIRKHPEQWFWMHRRWKRKWNKGKGMDENLHPAALPRRKSR